MAQAPSRFLIDRRGEKPAAPKTFTTGPLNLWTTLQTVKDPASGASKTTRAMEVPGGVVINTCTRGAAFAAEALVFVPGVAVMRQQNKTGYLVAKA